MRRLRLWVDARVAIIQDELRQARDESVVVVVRVLPIEEEAVNGEPWRVWQPFDFLAYRLNNDVLVHSAVVRRHQTTMAHEALLGPRPVTAATEAALRMMNK